MLSVSQMVKNDYSVVFSKKGCAIYNNDKKMIASGIFENDLFKLNVVSKSDDHAYSAKSANDTFLWHRRMGHISVSNMKFLNVDIKKDFNCIICAEGKQSRTPFPSSGSRASGLLDVIHSDVWSYEHIFYWRC